MGMLSILIALLCIFFASEEQGIHHISLSENGIVYGTNIQELCLGIWQADYVTTDLQGEDLLNYFDENFSLIVNGSEISHASVTTSYNLGNIPAYDVDDNLIGSHTGYFIVCVERTLFLDDIHWVEFSVPHESMNNPSQFWIICN